MSQLATNPGYRLVYELLVSEMNGGTLDIDPGFVDGQPGDARWRCLST